MVLEHVNQNHIYILPYFRHCYWKLDDSNYLLIRFWNQTSDIFVAFAEVLEFLWRHDHPFRVSDCVLSSVLSANQKTLKNLYKKNFENKSCKIDKKINDICAWCKKYKLQNMEIQPYIFCNTNCIYAPIVSIYI